MARRVESGSALADKALALALCAAACGPAPIALRAPPPPPDSDTAQRVGDGNYYRIGAPVGARGPEGAGGQRVAPKVTTAFSGVPTANDWWSSLIWPFVAGPEAPYSMPLYAHPLVLKAERDGLGLSYPTTPALGPRHYWYAYEEDLRIGLMDLSVAEAQLASYGDWTVTAAWSGADSEFSASFGHGLPFVYARRLRGSSDAKVTLTKRDGVSLEVFHEAGGWLGISVGEHHYMVSGPRTATWKRVDDGFTSDLAGAAFFSVALLPDRTPEVIELFRRHAYGFVTDSRVTFTYDEQTATQRTRYELFTELVEPADGRVGEALVALYPHQWRASRQAFDLGSYVSPRGRMKLLRAGAFETARKFGGFTPILPNVAADAGELEYLLKEVRWVDDLFPPGLSDPPQKDAYWIGKSLLKLALAAEIADQVGEIATRDDLLTALKNEISDWFDGRAPGLFYYDSAWRSLIGVPSSFGSANELNDHHFHYGYYLYAAALVARHDPAWAERVAPFMELLIKDVANWDRSDQRFPFLRNMDVYAGHSWANGPQMFAEGNNQEASSEDINFSAGLLLWGAALGHRELRDLGVYLYSEQVAAVEDYWFDIHGDVFPAAFEHTTAAMIWGAGARYDTWWDPNPVFVHGINFLPITGASVYLGRHPDYVRANYAELVRNNRGEPTNWRDVHLMFLAFADAAKADELLERDSYFRPEFGNSKAMLYHHVKNLAALGIVDPSVSANQPTALAFAKAGRRTHVAFNPLSHRIDVEFSDGVRLGVPARSTAHDFAK
jgi:endoglucanase Acf2